MDPSSQEARVILALKAIQNGEKLSLRAAAKLYDVPRTTLQHRSAGKPARSNTTANSKKLTQLEEEAVVGYIVELASRAFPPRLCGVEDMANHLLRERNAPPVGKRWAHNFVKRHPQLRTCWARRYDYQRAKCEDPEIIGAWFKLVQKTKAKYGILDEDVWNFDETGFIIGMIFPGNAQEANFQVELVKTRITNHQTSSPTIMTAVEQLGKGATAMMHQVALLRTEVSALRKANEALSKRRRAKKTRVQLGGSITVQDAQDQLAQEAVGGKAGEEREQDGSGARGARTKVRCCSKCGKPGHNARTCKKATEASDTAVLM